MTMFSLGVFYVLQQGPFLGMVQIIVYTGAIMMLFLFVLMLVGVTASDSLVETCAASDWLLPSWASASPVWSALP